MISNFLRREKSAMQREIFFELLHARDTEAMMKAIELFQGILLFLNLNRFLANQIAFKILMIAELTYHKCAKFPQQNYSLA